MEAYLPESVHAGITSGIEFIYSLEKFVKPTVILVPHFLDEPLESLSASIGFDVETLKYTLGMFLCYPLGLIMQMIPYGKMKHLFSFLLGAFLIQFIVGTQWIHQLITSLVVYAMFLVLPRKTCKTVVPVFLMLYMTAAHLHRQFINYLGWDMDFTSMQMVITIKLYSLAYNLYDGEQLAAGKEDRAAKKCAQFAVYKLPGLLEFLGFTFCFSNCLAGPAFEYTTYAAACDGSLLYNKETGKPKGKIPSNVWPTLFPLLKSLTTLGLFIVGSGAFPLLDPVDPQKNIPVLISEQMLAKPWAYRYAYMWVSLIFIRLKYYFGWTNAEGANNTWYAGFEGFDKDGKALGWENASNIDIIAFETAGDVKTLSSQWNKKTANWLSRYVYIRTGGSLTATYGLSAFWHGFYPGYYLFFLSVPLLTACERIVRKKISPRFADQSKLSPYGILCSVVTSILVEYSVVTFPLLALEWSWECWKSHYFFGHVACVLFLALSSFIPTPKKKDAKKEA